MNTYDVIIVGAGHAGVEAAYIAAKMKAKTLLITIDKNRIGVMPCNPSIGGLGKGHIVYEVSALGGLMPQLCTKTYLQARMLNTRKGPAVQGLRLQVDKYAYSKLAQETLARENLTIVQNSVTELLWHDEQGKRTITGVRCLDGKEFLCSSLVITSGTYLNGVIHVGFNQRPGGKDDSPAVTNLSASIEAALHTKLGRLKTGTPPRLLQASIDFSQLEYQKAHVLDYLYEFAPVTTEEKLPCYIAYTNEKTHEIISSNIHRSARFGGTITGIGPRYCPSIEDKVARFPQRTSHHVFIEPEGGDHSEVYPAGLSTSLPLDVQQAYINSIKGLEHAVITKPGYAIEYDFLQPNHLTHSLETQAVEGLFFAGQINGTTGYEEAAGQGIIAGINAVLKARKQEPFILKRTESYIGVMIDDLITLGIDEPYRMFTSRAERRLILRQDNVFLRLMPYAKQLGTISEELYEQFLQEKNLIETTVAHVKQQRPYGPLFKVFFDLDFPEKNLSPLNITSKRALLCIHAEIRYDGYIEKELKEVAKTNHFQQVKIPATIDYNVISGLTKELQEKLTIHQPLTIAQAHLIPGMTPAAISLLIFHLTKQLSKS
jgi:glucose-inhibited division protein A